MTAWRGGLGRRDEGSVAVEFALTLPAVVLVLGVVLAIVAWMSASVAAAGTAAGAARIAAVEGEGAARTALAAVERPMTVDIDMGDPWVTVTVHAPVTGWLPAATATATARREG